MAGWQQHHVSRIETARWLTRNEQPDWPVRDGVQRACACVWEPEPPTSAGAYPPEERSSNAKEIEDVA